jgi:hypothetical protein
MTFDISDLWRRYNIVRGDNPQFINLMEWLDDHVGWCLTDNTHVLPIMGRGWRIECGMYKSNDSEYPHFCIMLEIDDDTLAVQYKLVFA